MVRISSKLPDTGTTIFTVMSQLAAEHGAINLAQGFPDFDPPAALLDAVKKHLENGNNQYAPMAGVPALLEAIAHKLAASYQININPETEITVTSGATEALYSAVAAFVNSGDEVIVFDPAYDSYEPAIRLAGGNAIHIPMTHGTFSIDWDRVASSINSATRMIIINTPHNPTGAVLTEEDIDALERVVSDTDIIVLSDEVYEHIIFDGAEHQSILRRASLRERSLAVFSFGKTFHATGWKIGYCVAAAPLMREFRRVHQFVQFCVVSPMQFALADYLPQSADHYLSLSGFYASRRDRFIELLQGSGFSMAPAAGTYFQLADYSELSDLQDTEFARWLTIEKGVAAIPISVFYREPPAQKMVRFCFAKNPATLAEAAEKLCRI